MLALYKNVFMAELLVAEFLFTFRLKRRSRYWLRVICVAVVCFATSFLFPINDYNAFYSSFMFLALTILTIIGLIFIYDEPFLNIIYCAVAAYTVRHLAFQLFSLFLTIVTGSGASANVMYGPSAGDISSVTSPVLPIVGYILCYFIVYTLYYTFFACKIGADGNFEMQKPNLLIWVIVILFVDIVLNAIVVYNSTEENFLNSKVLFVNTISIYLYNILCCFFMLFIQYVMIDVRKLQKEISVINHIWRQEREQYEISKENISLINRKCHDLKYQVRKIAGGQLSDEQKKEIEKIIDIYDSMLKTGNEALDIIFSEKSLLCLKNDIRLNCMIDGEKLFFMKDADLYVLFGNVLDNAMEAVEKIESKEKRIISMNVYAENGALKIFTSNYYEGELVINEYGIPNTTKNDKEYHGIGLRSVALIAESYGGKSKIKAEDGIFSLEITIPVPEKHVANKQ